MHKTNKLRHISQNKEAIPVRYAPPPGCGWWLLVLHTKVEPHSPRRIVWFSGQVRCFKYTVAILTERRSQWRSSPWPLGRKSSLRQHPAPLAFSIPVGHRSSGPPRLKGPFVCPGGSFPTWGLCHVVASWDVGRGRAWLVGRFVSCFNGYVWPTWHLEGHFWWTFFRQWWAAGLFSFSHPCSGRMELKSCRDEETDSAAGYKGHPASVHNPGDSSCLLHICLKPFASSGLFNMLKRSVLVSPPHSRWVRSSSSAWWS